MITGTKSSGSDFTGINDALKQTYAGPMATNIEGESEVITAFSDAGDFETQDGPDGKQVNLGLYISAGGGVGAMLEDDYFYDNMAPAWAQASLTIKQLTATVSLSGRVLRRAIEGPAAFATWAEKALPEKAKRLAFHRDRMLLGTGTGIIGRISGTPDGTGDQINAIFGVASLGTALNSILRDDLLRYSPNANGSSPRAGVAHVVRVNYGADTFDTDLTTALGTPAIPTSAAANDYVFLGSANVNGSGSRELMGLEGHLDDGTNVSTYQGLTRSSYPDVLYAQIVDSTASYGGNLSEDLIDYTDALCYERAGGKPDLLLAARNGGRSFWKSLRGDRVLNDPQGAFQGGKASLRMLLGDRVVEVRVARKIPSSRAYLIDRSVMKRFKIGSGRWDDVTGSIWNRFTDSTGQKDAVTAYWVQEEEYASFFPARCAQITGLAAA